MIAFLLKLLGPNVIDRVLSSLERRANTETERQRIESVQRQHAQTVAANVVMAGMQHKAFWIPWLIAAIPTSLWYGWGMLDSLCNGALPDVAALPPQLLRYADVVFNNIFYSGAALGGAQMIAGALRRK